MGDFQAISIPSIVIICFLFGVITKFSPIPNKYIPAICGLAGGCLGLLMFFLMPDLIPSVSGGGDPFMCVAVGISSGFAATGVHQVGSQLSDKGDG